MGRNPILSGRTYGEELARAEKLAAQRSPEGPSDPAPAPESEPPTESDMPPPRKPQPSVADHVEAVELGARYLTALYKIGAAIVGAIVLAVPATSFAIREWVVKPELAALRAVLDPAIIRPTKEDEERAKRDGEEPKLSIKQQFKAMGDKVDHLETAFANVDSNNPDGKLGHKLDALDATFQKRFPATPMRPALPPVGPTAAREGRQ